MNEEIEYFMDVARFWHTVQQMLVKHGLVKEPNVKIVRPNGIGTINPYGIRLVSDGAFVVNMNTDTKGNPFMPVDICTPYGPMYVEAKTYYFGSENVLRFFEDFSKEFCPVKRERFGSCVCAITRLPWKPEKTLPSNFDLISGIRSSSEYEQLRGYVDKLIEKANEAFEKEGHPEFVLEDASDRQK